MSGTAPVEPVEGVTYLVADVLDDGAPGRAVAAADVVVGALSPRGAPAGRMVEVMARVLAALRGSDETLDWFFVSPAHHRRRFTVAYQARPRSQAAAPTLSWGGSEPVG